LCGGKCCRSDGRPRPSLGRRPGSFCAISTLAIRLPESIEKRLEKLAQRTGRTKTYYVREAILQHLDDLEDMYLAERVLDRIRDGEENTVPLEDVMKRHGLEG